MIENKNQFKKAIKENRIKEINEGTNANYKYKFVIMINKIIEK